MSMFRALRTVVALGAIATAVSISTESWATRSGIPSDGAPFPADSYSKFTYSNGSVLHRAGAAPSNINWDLPAVIDSSGTKSARIVTRGAKGGAVRCWPVGLSGADGSVVIGTPVSGTSGCNVVSPITVGGVNVVGSPLGSFLVTCELPGSIATSPVCSTPSAILQYNYDQ